jgi:Uma2 family endonuclease
MNTAELEEIEIEERTDEFADTLVDERVDDIAADMTDDFAVINQREFSDYERERGKPMPSKNHSRLQIALSGLFFTVYRKQYTAYSELSLNLAGDKLTPDVCLYPYEPANWLHDQNPVTEPPLLAIEIISPSQSVTEMLAKARRYFAGGVQSFWLVQPELRTISVYYPNDTLQTFSAGTVHDTSNGIEISFTDVFEG